MSDRLHEIIAVIGVLHKELIQKDIIKDAKEVFSYIDDYDSDVKSHYLNLLLQYYFQKNDLKNVKELLLKSAKFDMRLSDIKDAFVLINSNDNNVIEFMEDNVMYINDSVLEEPLNDMYKHYKQNENLQVYLEESVEIIKRNRFVCAYCYKNKDKEFSEFFINEDLLESLKRDLPHLLK